MRPQTPAHAHHRQQAPRKLGEDSRDPTHVCTEHGVGHRVPKGGPGRHKGWSAGLLAPHMATGLVSGDND